MIAPFRIALIATVTVALMVPSLGRVEANPVPKPDAPAAAAKDTKSTKPSKSSKPVKPVKVTTDTRVYLMRGLLNVFSLGMDTLSERLNGMGIEAEVFN